MTKLIFIGALLGGLGLSGACGSSDAGQSTDPTCSDPTAAHCSIIVNDGSFVRWTGAATDGLPSTAVVEHTPGTFCMSGTVDAGTADSGWGAFLVLGLIEGPPMSGRVVSPFDATAHGITQLRFTVDSPPATGVLPQIHAAPERQLHDGPGLLQDVRPIRRGHRTGARDGGARRFPGPR